MSGWADAFVQDLAGVPVLRDALLAKRTTFGIGGPADVLVSATHEAEVERVLSAARRHGQPVFVLGGGSNLLVGDRGIRGVVLTLNGELAALTVSGSGSQIGVGAGVTYPRLTRTALDLGWPSAVGWMGTPGQVGGALKMNAGTRDGEIGDVVVEVTAVSADGVQRLAKSACGFGYRKSAFAAGLVLTRAQLQCDNRQSNKVENLDQMAKTQLARRHQSQPKLRSAGSIFKNPPGDFAGRLIEASGLKGTRVGGAQISPIHANFIVNLGNARAADVLELADHAATQVKSAFGVELEWEVRRVGEFG